MGHFSSEQFQTNSQTIPTEVASKSHTIPKQFPNNSQQFPSDSQTIPNNSQASPKQYSKMEEEKARKRSIRTNSPLFFLPPTEFPTVLPRGTRLRQEVAETSYGSCMIPRTMNQHTMEQWLGTPRSEKTNWQSPCRYICRV